MKSVTCTFCRNCTFCLFKVSFKAKHKEYTDVCVSNLGNNDIHYWFNLHDNRTHMLKIETFTGRSNVRFPCIYLCIYKVVWVFK